MDKKDIGTINLIIDNISKRNSGTLFYNELEQLIPDESLRERALLLLEKYAAINRNKYTIEKTNILPVIISNGKAQYIYDKENEAITLKKLEKEDLELSIHEKKRNKVLSIISIIIASISIILSIITLACK